MKHIKWRRQSLFIELPALIAVCMHDDFFLRSVKKKSFIKYPGSLSKKLINDIIILSTATIIEKFPVTQNTSESKLWLPWILCFNESFIDFLYAYREVSGFIFNNLHSTWRRGLYRHWREKVIFCYCMS